MVQCVVLFSYRDSSCTFFLSVGKRCGLLHVSVCSMLLRGQPKASPAFDPRRCHQKKKNTDYIVLAPASFLTFGKVNPGPLQTDIFLGGGRPTPFIFVSAGPFPSDWHFCPPGIVLDIWEGQLS